MPKIRTTLDTPSIPDPTPSVNGTAPEDAPLLEAAAQAEQDLSSAEPLTLPSAPHVTSIDGMTDTANALRLLSVHGDDLRYVGEWKDWIVWDGQRWSRDGVGPVRRLASEVAKRLWDVVVDGKAHEGTRRQITPFAAYSNNLRGLNAAVTLAQDHVPIGLARLDTHPLLLNVANGTLDLSTGKLWRSRRKDYLTKLCPTEYLPRARCPSWKRCLADIFLDRKDLLTYFQRLLGYCLTGEVNEQILPILWGEGSNGKSTIVNTLSKVLGSDYSGTPPRELFLADQWSSARHPTQLMTLQGKRLAIAQETECEARLSEALIKYLTGGDAITARGMYENFGSFSPTHKILLSTNYRPQVRGTDHAIWRRLKLIPFSARFSSKPDRSKGEKPINKRMEQILLTEASGILNWLVQGCLDWQRYGLQDPECVQIVTEEYRHEQDVVGGFLRECCQVGTGYCEGASELYQAFKEWIPDNGTTAQAFGRELARRGYVRGTRTSPTGRTQKAWKGIRLANI
jgi:putative DNA primase/helicase